VANLIVGAVFAAIALAAAVFVAAIVAAFRKDGALASRVEERAGDEPDVAERAPGHVRHHEEAAVHAHGDGFGEL
jgi:hypothetical protein